MRTCPRCHKKKRLGEFQFKASPGRKSCPTICKPCNREKARLYYLKNPEYYHARSRAWHKAHPEQHAKIIREWRHKQRRDVLTLLGGICVRCGEGDWHCLQIDHIDGGGNKEIKKIGTAGIHRKIVGGDRKKYQLLCANCNQKKRYEKGEGVRLN